mgnify:CR=1 FL=1
MCGIAGFFGKNKHLPNNLQIKECLNLMYNRGPDAKGKILKKFEKKSLLFLHSRLSIIDLSEEANQPFEDDNGILIFNGEIYNYLELKKICKKKKIKFKTNSDTEVLLKILNLYGEKAVNYLDGMWAFAYFDKKNKRMILSRDIFGEKPLYYLENKEKIIFASNLKYVESIYKKKFTLNLKKIETFLAFGFKAFGNNDQTIFNEVKSLLPGNTIIIDQKNQKKIKEFFTFYKKKIDKISYSNAVKSLRNKIRKIFNTRFRSDVPLSNLLSGGIDSSSISAIAEKQKKNVSHFSLKHNSKNYNEDNLINENIKFFNLNHKFVNIPKKKNLKEFEKIMAHSYNVMPSLTSLAFAIVCKKIKSNGFKVVLTGIGGDELFKGYYHHFLSFLYSIKNKKYFEKYLKLWEKNQKPYIRSKEYRDFHIVKKIAKKNNTIHSFHEDHELEKYFIKKNKFKKRKYSNNFMHNAIINDIKHYSLPNQLEYADNISMYYSLEARSPFLSKDILKFSNRLPDTYFFKNGYPKSILRDAMKPIMSKKIIYNLNKVGFYISFSDFFGREIEMIKRILIKSKILKKIIKKDTIKILLQKKKIQHSESKFLFSLLNVAMIENLNKE